MYKIIQSGVRLINFAMEKD